jgi:hypothetical protein
MYPIGCNVINDRTIGEILTSIGYPEAACRGSGRRWPTDAAIPIADAARTGRAVCVGSPEAWSERYGAHPTSSSRAWAALPITRSGAP